MGLIYSFFLFSAVLFLTAFSQALLLLKKTEIQALSQKNGFFAFFQKQFLNYHFFEQTIFQLRLTSLLLLIAAFLSLAQRPFSINLVFLSLFFALDYLVYLGAYLAPRPLFLFSMPAALFSLYVLYPITSPFLNFFNYKNKQALTSKSQLKRKLQDLLSSDYDEKLFASFATFNEKDAREVMAPRIKIFALPAATSIKTAAKALLTEGYSRVPVYGKSLDDMVGVLMYKDLLKVCIQSEKTPNLLNETIEMLLKPVIYAPENKKISMLFQDLRKKQRHLAVIVNEYGGTEGIITVEDILEELVGEIKDEYDFEEEEDFWKLPGGSWIVDAKSSIIDVEKKLGIRIPHSPEYETIGGFLFHKAGSIPQKGWSLCLDEFEIEVLISSERCLEKLRLIPLVQKKEKIAKE